MHEKLKPKRSLKLQIAPSPPFGQQIRPIFYAPYCPEYFINSTCVFTIEKCFLFYFHFFSWTWKTIDQEERFNIYEISGVPSFLENIAYPFTPFFGKAKSFLSATNESVVCRNYRGSGCTLVLRGGIVLLLMSWFAGVR